MHARVAAEDAVVAVGIDLHVELLAQLNQMFGILGTVLVVHVVVGHAVYQQEVSVQFVGTGEGRRCLVALGVLLRRAHEAFAIDGVVVVPVGHSCYGHTCLEYGSTLAHTHDSHVATEAPAPDTDAVLVHVGQAAQVEGRLHLVAGFFDAQVQVGAFLEVGTASACASSVHANYNVALRSHERLPADAEGVEHLLRAGAAILVLQGGIFLGGREVGGLHHPAVQLGTVGSGEAEEFLLRQVVFSQLGTELLVVYEGGQHLSAVVVQRDDHRRVEAGVAVQVVLHVRAELGRIGALLRGEFQFLAFAVGLIDGGTHGALLVAGIVEGAFLRVVTQEIFYLEVARSDLLGQAARHVVPVEVVVAAAFADEAEVVVVENDLIEYVLLDILVALVAEYQLAHRAARIGEIEIEAVLMAVQCHDGQLFGVFGEADAGNVAVFVHRNVDLADDAALDVERVNADLRIGFARLGVLVFIGAGILLIGLDVGLVAGKDGEGVRFYLALVPAHKGQHFAVGAEL